MAEVSKRLNANNGNNPCAKLFGGAKKAWEKLSKADISFLLLGFAQVTPLNDGSGRNLYFNRDAITNRSGNTIIINTAGAFTTGSFIASNGVRVPRSEKLNLSRAAYGAPVLWHELGHLYGPKVYGKYDSDYLNPYAAYMNDKKIADACFKEAKLPAP